MKEPMGSTSPFHKHHIKETRIDKVEVIIMHRTEVHTDLFSRYLSIYSAKSNEGQPLSRLTSKPKPDLEHFSLARERI